MGGKTLTIVILLVLGAVAFAVSFTLSRWFGAPPAPAAAAQTAGGENAEALNPADLAVQETPRVEEKHLYDLIKEVRQKVRDCQKREQDLAEQDKRLQMTRQLLEKETQGLENQRMQLATSIARLKDAQTELEKTRIAIAQQEQANLKRAAAIYDKMDAAAAAQIFQGLCTNQQEADAVRIFFYMQERSVAKVLAEISDKNLAAKLSEEMKRVREQGAAPAETGRQAAPSGK
jgi:flagellar motility protein MotE (MotC chaperone)